MALDRSPFDASGGPRRPRRPGTGLLGLLAAVAAVLVLALGTWALGSVDRVVPPVDPRSPAATQSVEDRGGDSS